MAKQKPQKRNFTVETEPFTAGNVIQLALEAYPDIEVHSMAACNNIRLHPITQQPMQTAVVFLIYSLPDGGKIEESKLNLPGNEKAKAAPLNIYKGPQGEA